MGSLNYTAIQLALRTKLATLSAATTTPFARASTANYTDVNGIVQSAGINVVRNAHYVSGISTVLYEPAAATNSALWSRDLTNAVWLVTGTPTRTLDQVGLNGTANSATLLSDTDAATANVIYQSITVPLDTNTHAVSVYIKKDSTQTRFPEIEVRIQGGTVVNRHVSLNTQSGAIALVSGTGTTTQRVVDSGLWWTVEITATNNASASNTTLQVIIAPAGALTLGGALNGTTTGSIIVGQVQVELNTTAYTSPVFTTSATATRSADVDILLSATATGYARATGSFITDGISPGQEITPVGFATNVSDTVQTVTALTVTTLNSKTVETAVAGRSLSVLTFSFAGENLKFTPITGRPYIEEQLVPGPTDLSSFGAFGNITAEPIYVLNVYTPSNEGFLGGSRYVDSLMALFCPSTTMTLSTGDAMFVRADIGPYRGQVQQVDGWACISVKIPLRIYTSNAI